MKNDNIGQCTLTLPSTHGTLENFQCLIPYQKQRDELESIFEAAVLLVNFQVIIILLPTSRITIIDKGFQKFLSVCDRKQRGDNVARKVYVITVVLTIFLIGNTRGCYKFMRKILYRGRETDDSGLRGNDSKRKFLEEGTGDKLCIILEIISDGNRGRHVHFHH